MFDMLYALDILMTGCQNRFSATLQRDIDDMHKLVMGVFMTGHAQLFKVLN